MKKKLWLDMTNPYVMNYTEVITPICMRWVECLKKMVICQIMVAVHLVDLIAQTFFIVGRTLSMGVDSLFQLLIIYGRKTARPIMPTWESFIQSWYYIGTKAMFKEPGRRKKK